MAHFSLKLILSAAALLGASGAACAGEILWPMTTSDAGYTDPGAGVVRPVIVYEGRSAFAPTEFGGVTQDLDQTFFPSEVGIAPQSQ